MLHVQEKEATAEKLRAELAALREKARGLLTEAAEAGGETDLEFAGETGHEEAETGREEEQWEEQWEEATWELEELSGIELAFGDDGMADSNGDDSRRPESSIRLPSGLPSGLLDALAERIARHPAPWIAGAVVLGVLGARRLCGPGQSKNGKEKTSQVGDFPITHGSFLELIKETGIDLARPVLVKASKEWLSRIVETRR